MYKALACVLVLLFYLETIECKSEDMQNMLKEVHAACQTEIGVPEAMIEEARKGKFSEDNTLKCYLKCVWVKMGIMDDKGKIDIKTTLAVLPDEMKTAVEPTVKKCATIVGVDACDTALLVNKCYYENSPEFYFVV